jgi:hypothetical protein
MFSLRDSFGGDAVGRFSYDVEPRRPQCGTQTSPHERMIFDDHDANRGVHPAHAGKSIEN